MSNKTKIIAVAGKGGVGKTSLAGVIVKLLVESFPDKKILAIDADPAVGLSTVLNVDVDKTIDDIRKAQDTIKDIVKRTDILESTKLSLLTNANIY